MRGRDRWKHGGTGLGLTLVKRLVEHLHSSIGVESATGWTCFTIDLPLKAQFSEKLLHEGINCQSVANETID